MLKKLCEMIGVSGDEEEVRNYIRNQIESYADELIEDAYGNLIVRKGKDSDRRIMLAAHMDEVGFMITVIEKNGLLRFKPIGIPARVLLGKRVVFRKKEVKGIIGVKPIHQLKPEEKEKVPQTDQLFIDIGAGSKEEAEKIVEIGDYCTFDTRFSKQGDIIFGKAFDNRIGCYVLIQLLKNYDLPGYYAFTVQEELGLRGARIAGYRVDPQIALAVDTTASGRWPTEKDLPQYPQITKGPAISIADRSVICDKELTDLIIETAQKNGIPYQFKRPMIGGTDAGVIHLVKTGVRAAVLCTPARYIHSPLSIASMNDIEAMIKLLGLSIKEILNKGALWN